ncbi:MAG: hypothetical protein GVY34_03775 [Alphaproteobacteria bacterium]|jgi:flagellar hook-associated protein 3 FlgL|nr:hypothetical protein [Alphaproteobacteria bacterium]
MFHFGTSDLAQNLMLRRSGTQLRETVSRLTAELSSGQHQDTSRALNGALTQLGNIEHGLGLSAQHIASANFAATFLAAQQSAISQVGQLTQDLALDLQTSTSTPNDAIVSEAGNRAKQGFEHAIGLLNSQVAGRHLFSGVSGDVQPFADPDVILDALVTSLPPTPSTTDIRQHVESWFAVGGPFDTIAYQGGEKAATGLDLGDQTRVRLDLDGSGTYQRDALAGLALGAIAQAMPTPPSSAEQRDLLSLSARLLFQSDDSRVALQSSIGTREARVDEAKTHAQARMSTLQIARNDLLAADPYDTASALESASQKLDALYLVTARLSRLSLTEYMR